jgi:hypothetical protein
MGGKSLLTMLAATILLACQPAPQLQLDSHPVEPLDPFVVMIGAERWGVIIDRALQGVREAPGIDRAFLENEMLRADVALKSGAANLLELRNEACAKLLVTGADCALEEWPAWVLEAPTGDTPIEEIERRSDWLAEQMGAFTSAGCEAGRQATGDELFCSVE